jgi:hypothetical protein
MHLNLYTLLPKAMRIVLLVMLSCSFSAAQSVRLLVDPSNMSVSKGYQRFKVRVANDSDKPVCVVKPTDPLNHYWGTSQGIGLAQDPYSVNFNQKNSCAKPIASAVHMFSSSDLITILPGETREIGELENRNLFKCIESDSTYSFTLMYRPIVKLMNLSANDFEKLEQLKKRLRSIETRMYNLGLTVDFAGTGGNLRDLGTYVTYDSDILKKITNITLTSNAVKISK